MRLAARLALACAVFVGAVAHAEEESVCQRVRHEGLADGPVVIGQYDADFGTGRRACLHHDFSFAQRLGATLDTPGFYGGVRADSIVAGTFRLRPYLELFSALELVRWEFVQNAVIKSTAIGLGQLSVGAQGRIYEGPRFAVAAFGRVLVPLATTSPSVQTTGVELGLTGLYRPRRDVELHAQVTGDFTAGLSAGPALVRGGSALSIGVQYAPATWFALAVDLQAVLGHRAALDALLPMIALRFRVWRSLGIELSGTSPVVGADRRLALAALRVGWRF